MTTQHTLTPLSVKKNGRHFTLAAPSVSGMPGSYLDVGTIWDEQHAAFIIKAVNSHDQLQRERQFYKDQEQKLRDVNEALLEAVKKLACPHYDQDERDEICEKVLVQAEAK